MSHSHSVVHHIDENSSTPVDTAGGTSLPIPDLSASPTGSPIAEFGLAVEEGQVGNFVKIDGTVGVSSVIGTGPTVLQNVLVRVYRRDTLLPEAFPGTLVFSTIQSLAGALDQHTISFNFVDGGNNTSGQPQVPASYYGYTMTVTRDTVFLVDPILGPQAVDPALIPSPNVTGPIQLSGSSNTTDLVETH